MIKTTKALVRLSRYGDNKIVLDLSDSFSGDHLLELTMNPEDLGLLMTGFKGMVAKCTVNLGANFACTKELKDIELDTPINWPFMSNHDKKEFIRNDFAKRGLIADNWQILYYRVDTKECTPQHAYTVVKYTPVNPKEI